MSSSIALSSAIRSNLLALQNTQSLTNQTQNHLATGEKVASAIDNPVAYFQASALSSRASDFQNDKDNIDQGISNLSTALQGITSIQTLVSQLKGLALSAQSASSTQISGLVSQYNSLRGQINSLAADSSYQGLNLIAGTGQQLTVNFSNLTGSNLTVSSVDATTDAAGLNIVQAATSNGGFQLGFQSVGSGVVGYGKTVQVVYSATAALTSGTYSFAYGSQNLSILVASAGGSDLGGLTTTATFAPGTVYTLAVGSGSIGAEGALTENANVTSGNSSVYESTGGAFFISVAANTGATFTTALGESNTINFTLDGLTGSTLSAGSYTFNYGGAIIGFEVGSLGTDANGNATVGAFDTATNFSNGEQLSLTVENGGTTQAGNTNTLGSGESTGAGVGYIQSFVNGGSTTSPYSFASTVVTVSGYYYGANTSNIIYASLSGANDATTNGGVTTYGIAGNDAGETSAISGQTYLDANLLGAVNQLTNQLDTNLQTLQANAQSLGTNVALLNTRLDFTNNYVNLLTAGAGKLTLADLNQEGANLLALQTRQQLGIQSLSFAGQNEKSILQLFR